jgi:hypothetical protein
MRLPTDGGAGEVKVDAVRLAYRIAVRVEPPYGQVAVIEVHPYYRAVGTNIVILTLSADDVGTRSRTCPRSDEVSTTPVRLAGDRVRHRLAASNARAPLVSAV